MKNVLRSALVAAAVAAGASSAQATSLTWAVPGYAGPIYIQYSNFDVGRLYNPGIVTPVLPGAAGAAAVDAATGTGATLITGSSSTVEDTWGTVKVSGIYAGFDNTGIKLYEDSSPIQLTGIFWGGRDIQLDSTPVVSQQVWSDSLQMSFFASKVGDNTDGLDFPLSGGLAGSRTNLPGNIPVFAGVTDGSLVWTLKGTPGVSASNPFAEMHVNIDLTALSGGPPGQVVGGGTMFLNLGKNDMGTGLQNGMLYADPLNPDVSVAFQDYKPPAGSGYTVRSSDPALAIAVPTPSAAYGGALLAGLIGLNTLRRRRAQ
jgi:hypothetical protein